MGSRLQSSEHIWCGYACLFEVWGAKCLAGVSQAGHYLSSGMCWNRGFELGYITDCLWLWLNSIMRHCKQIAPAERMQDMCSLSCGLLRLLVLWRCGLLDLSLTVSCPDSSFSMVPPMHSESTAITNSIFASTFHGLSGLCWVECSLPSNSVCLTCEETK